MKLQIPLGLLFALCTAPLFAQTTQTWSTGTAGSNWSVPGNWSPAGDPSGNDLVFGDGFGKTADSTTVGNIVDQSYTINSLAYNNTTAGGGNIWQVTEIAAGATLTLDSASGTPPNPIFTVGGVTSASTRVAILGSGTLTVNEPGASIYVGGPTANQSALMDLSGLSTFNATVATLNFGGNASRANGDVTLADTNSLTAATLNLGTSTLSTGNNSKSDLRLGTSNTLHIDTINVGANYGSGTIAFRGGLTNPSVTLRAQDGISRANLTVANTNAIFVNNSQGSSVDFRGGSVDALLDQLIVGRRADSNAVATYFGSFAMDAGTVDANTVVLGQTAGAGNASGLVTATLTVEGGTLKVNNSLTMAQNSEGATDVDSTLTVAGGTVEVAGDLVAGDRTGTASTVAATVNVSAGTLLVEGNLTEGANPSGVTSTVNLSGGTLDMTHGAVAVDSFDFTGGTLKNAASFAASATGALDLQNNATLSFDLDSAFTTLNLTGGLILGAASNLELILADGFMPQASFTLVANDLGDLIDGTFATINGGGFGADDTFFLTNDLGTFEYQLIYDGGGGNDLLAVAVPEPSVFGLLLAFGIGAIAAGRCRKKIGPASRPA